MKYWFRCMVVAVGFLAWQSLALADLPRPKERTENPNVVPLGAKRSKRRITKARWDT